MDRRGEGVYGRPAGGGLRASVRSAAQSGRRSVGRSIDRARGPLLPAPVYGSHGGRGRGALRTLDPRPGHSAGRPVRRSVGRSVGPSAGPSVRRSVGRSTDRARGPLLPAAPVYGKPRGPRRVGGPPDPRSAPRPLGRTAGRPVGRTAGRPDGRSTVRAREPLLPAAPIYGGAAREGSRLWIRVDHSAGQPVGAGPSAGRTVGRSARSGRSARWPLDRSACRPLGLSAARPVGRSA